MAVLDVNAAMGKVGLPAPLSELSAREWDAIVVGGGHNGLTAAAYLAEPAAQCWCSSVGSSSGEPARWSNRFPTRATWINPCAYVVGLLDDLVVRELDSRDTAIGS